jgi:hypothetical protein
MACEDDLHIGEFLCTLTYTGPAAEDVRRLFSASGRLGALRDSLQETIDTIITGDSRGLVRVSGGNRGNHRAAAKRARELHSTEERGTSCEPPARRARKCPHSPWRPASGTAAVVGCQQTSTSRGSVALAGVGATRRSIDSRRSPSTPRPTGCGRQSVAQQGGGPRSAHGASPAIGICVVCGSACHTTIQCPLVLGRF